MIISISGDPGSGKSTLAQALAKKLKYKRYYMGGIRRDLAKKKKMTLAEYNKYGETHPETDLELDNYQTKLGQTKNNFVIEGRTSWYFIPQSVKIYVKCGLKEAAKRIYQDSLKNKKRNEDKNLNSEKAVYQSILKRIQSDKMRYKKYYGFDAYDTKNYDYVIDSTKLTKQEVLNRALDYLANFIKQ